MRNNCKPIQDAYLSLCLEVITAAVDDNVFWRNATLKDKQKRHWREYRKDGQEAETFLLRDDKWSNTFFEYAEIPKDLVIQEMISRLHDPEAWGTS